MKRLFFVLLSLLAVMEGVRSEPQLNLRLLTFNDEQRTALEVGARAAFAVLEDMDGTFDDLDITFNGRISLAGAREEAGDAIGIGGPTGGEFNVEGAPRWDILYPYFLASLLNGRDMNEDAYDYEVRMALVNVPWNYNPEGRGQEDHHCCVRCTAHEAGHGQGFGISFSRIDEEGNGFLAALTIWDWFLEDEDGTPLREYESGSRELGNAFTSNAIFWGGHHGTRANGGERIQIYAPRQFRVGTSIGHLSPEYHEEETMTPFFREGDEFERLSFGPREIGIFRDMLGIPFENEPPVIADIEDQSISEDDTLLVALDISDEDGDAVTLTVSPEDGEVTVSVTEEGMLSCIPDTDWHGETLVTLIASDVFEGADTLSFTLTVESVNDAPEAFALTSPQNGFEEDDTSSVIIFRWRASRDADGDRLLYGLVLAGENFEERYETENTSCDVAARTLPTNEEIHWRVWVTDGEDTMETNERTLTILVNRAPMFVQETGDTSISEDRTLSVLLYASDPDGDELSYRASSSEESVQTALQTNRLTMTPNRNWFGGAEILVTVSDGALSDTFTFHVTVLPVNDSPENFALLSPEDGYRTADTLSEISFSWEESEDIDSDSVRYTVIFGSSEREWEEETVNPNLPLRPSNFPRDETISWRVFATDGEDTVTTETWEFVIENPNSVSDKRHIPADFSLQNYPNPFNAVTTVQYSVPLSGLVRITAYDLTGRAVLTLVDEFREAGVYTFAWNAHAFNAGVYILSFAQNGRAVSVHKITLLR